MAKSPPILRPRRHVALIVETSKIYGREILLGISRYMQLHGAWSIFTAERGQNDPDPTWLADWAGDGIITRSVDHGLCRVARDRGIAVVSLRHWPEKPDFPTLFPDQRVIAQRIAGHLLDRGFRQFAYVGVTGQKGWELRRREAFIQTVTRKGGTLAAVREALVDPGLTWEQEEQQLAAWVRGLPTPIGIMVSHDTQGAQLLDACRRAGVRVPDDVGVVSVDNDPVLCGVATPPLSSLDQNAQRLGFEAAALLDRMMRGRKVAPTVRYTEPGHVVARQSSDIIAVADPRIVKAVRFVRENACTGTSVDAVAHAAGLSRRALEKKFVEHLGRTPLEELQENRFQRIRQLLLETDYVLPRIAELTGFQYQEYLVRFFKKRAGVTPGRFRREKRSRS